MYIIIEKIKERENDNDTSQLQVRATKQPAHYIPSPVTHEHNQKIFM